MACRGSLLYWYLMNSRLNWLLIGLLLISSWCWLNNRLRYKHEADLAETTAVANGQPRAAVASIRARGKQLDRELEVIKLFTFGLTALLSINVARALVKEQ